MTDPESSNPAPSPELHGLDPGELLARGLNTVRPSGGVHGWTPPTPEELAKLIPQYHIESLIGHGGMGAVYKGFQEKLNRPVAIKLLPAELTADAQFVTRFEREAITLARLQHPGIVAIYDFGQTADGHLYFVMEYVEGTDLRRVMQGPGLNPEQALEVIVQVCEALHAAHRQGVIHRDIKPANILITTDERVKLADFGLARPDRDENEGLTLSNVVLGTPDYMAPEQQGGQPDHRADIFALGLMLYEMLTGQLPRGAWVPPSRKVQVDVRIDEVVIRALQEEPDLRYQQASEMKTDVDHIRATVVETAPPVSVPPPSAPENQRGKVLMIAIPVVLLLGLAAFFLFRRSAVPVPEKPIPLARETPAPIPESPAPASPEQTPMETAGRNSPASEPSPVGEPVPQGLEDVLFDFDWQYRTTRAASDSRESYSFVHGLFFESDGTVYSRGRKQLWKWLWTATGPRTVHIDQQFRGYTIDITFDPSLTKFEGRGTDGSSLAGHREKRFSEEEILKVRQQIHEKIGQSSPPEKVVSEETDTDGPSGAPSAPPAPEAAALESPAALPRSEFPADPTPKTASEALPAFRWIFDSPANKGEITFLPGGEMNKSWRQAFPWRWEAVGEREFMLREMGGKRRVTTLTLNEDFTSFFGPGFTEGQAYRGSRLMPPTAPASVPPSPTPPASPEKSNLDVLAESGPQITDQVLSPLDSPSIPESTVTSWEEDLLDEAAKRPPEFEAAYRQASALVAAWKSALRERYQILGTANFSGTVMDTGDMQSSRKTVLHMWDWLQYARERDDAAKHEKKLERTAEFFASGPPRRWADRSRLLRANIEKIYTAFRQARREALAKSPKPTAAP